MRRASGNIESLANTGGLVGLFDNLQFSEATLKLGHSDVVVGYTDGVTEAQHPNGEDYGIDRLISAVAAAPREASELLGWVEGDFNAFVEGVPGSDDITLFILSRD